MKERPILFSGAMVRALLDGRKTQTRRVVKQQPPVTTETVQPFHHPDPRTHFWANDGASLLDWAKPCPHGEVGDRLYVRESFRPVYPQDPDYNNGDPIEYDYKATYKSGDRLVDPARWKPSIHMPRVASRIMLEIVGVRCERLLDCGAADAIAEGISRWNAADSRHPKWDCPCHTRQLGESDNVETAIYDGGPLKDPVEAYLGLWDSLNFDRGMGG